VIEVAPDDFAIVVLPADCLVLAPDPGLPTARAPVIVPVSGNGTGNKLASATVSRQDAICDDLRNRPSTVKRVT